MTAPAPGKVGGFPHGTGARQGGWIPHGTGARQRWADFTRHRRPARWADFTQHRRPARWAGTGDSHTAPAPGKVGGFPHGTGARQVGGGRISTRHRRPARWADFTRHRRPARWADSTRHRRPARWGKRKMGGFPHGTGDCLLYKLHVDARVMTVVTGTANGIEN